MPACAVDLIVGNTLVANDVFVYFRNNGTGRIDMYQSEIQTDGDIVIATPELALNSSYEVWVSETDSTSPNEGMPIELDQNGVATTVTCYTLRFTNAQLGDYDIVEVKLV